MSKEKSDDLIKKYFAAKTSLEEEEELFNTINQQPGIEAWATFIRKNRKKAPPNLKGSVWAAIQTRKRKKQRFLVSLSGVAASIVLLVSFLIYNTSNRDIEYNEKAVLLNEALSMFPDENQTRLKQDVIYEDGMIVIYFESN